MIQGEVTPIGKEAGLPTDTTEGAITLRQRSALPSAAV